MPRIIVEYPGQPNATNDYEVDTAAERVGLEPGDTGYSFTDRVRDHSIEVPEGSDADALAAKMRLLLNAKMKVYVLADNAAWDA